MGYNYAKERAKWIKWKKEEEKLLRSLNVDEDIISQLYKYDWNSFKAERRFRAKQNVTADKLFNSVPHKDKKEIITVEDLLDEIENEALLHYLSQTDKTTLNILLFKMKGYSIKEISEILAITPSLIYSRIHRLKKILKKINDDAKK